MAGLTKDRFDEAVGLITQCRKLGLLPLDITAADSARGFDNSEYIFAGTPSEFVQAAIRDARECIDEYHHRSFWEKQDYFIQMVVEKIDLKQLFMPVCEEFRIRIANARGWSDLHMRADMMQSFKCWEDRGKEPVLLYCGDFDPAGVLISESMRSNVKEVELAVGWDSTNLVIDRFGLNQGFIEHHDLSWQNNLITGSGNDLANPPRGKKIQQRVQDWLETVGERKVEANVLVVRPDAGRQLCLDAITKYLDPAAPDVYLDDVKGSRDEAREIFDEILQGKSERGDV